MDQKIWKFEHKISWIHTHDVGLPQKLTELDIALEDKCLA